MNASRNSSCRCARRDVLPLNRYDICGASSVRVQQFPYTPVSVPRKPHNALTVAQLNPPAQHCECRVQPKQPCIAYRTHFARASPHPVFEHASRHVPHSRPAHCECSRCRSGPATPGVVRDDVRLSQYVLVESVPTVASSSSPRSVLAFDFRVGRSEQRAPAPSLRHPLPWSRHSRPLLHPLTCAACSPNTRASHLAPTQPGRYQFPAPSTRVPIGRPVALWLVHTVQVSVVRESRCAISRIV